MGVSPGPQKRVDAEELGREVIAQGYDRVNLCGEHKERMGKRGGGVGVVIERIKETPTMRKPIMLNRYSKYLYFKSPPRGLFI